MGRRILGYVGVGVVVLLLIGIVVVGFGFFSSEDEVVVEDLDLGRYRGEGIPVDCRLPVYENSVESWKEHLSHHEDTHYCLEYFS